MIGICSELLCSILVPRLVRVAARWLDSIDNAIRTVTASIMYRERAVI